MKSKKRPSLGRLGVAAKAEWVAIMCLLAKYDPVAYAEIRDDAWVIVERTYECLKDSN